MKYRMCGALILFLAGCAKTESENVSTAGFYVNYLIQGNNQNSALCTASFQVGGVTGTYLDLSSGDSVTCDGQSMNRSEFAGIVTYSANVPYQEGKNYEVVLTRDGEPAYVSSVVLPAAVASYSPAGTFSLQKGQALAVVWAPSVSSLDHMDVSLRYTAGSNSYSYYRYDSSPEGGILGFGSSETQVSPSVLGSWSGNLEFRRWREGTLSSFLEGQVRAEQRVSVGVSLLD